MDRSINLGDKKGRLKIWPEKFSGGGGWWSAVAVAGEVVSPEKGRERERESNCVCMCVKNEEK